MNASSRSFRNRSRATPGRSIASRSNASRSNASLSSLRAEPLYPILWTPDSSGARSPASQKPHHENSSRYLRRPLQSSAPAKPPRPKVPDFVFGVQSARPPAVPQAEQPLPASAARPLAQPTNSGSPRSRSPPVFGAMPAFAAEARTSDPLRSAESTTRYHQHSQGSAAASPRPGPGRQCMGGEIGPIGISRR